MENLTPTEIWAAVLAAASAIVLLSNAAEKIGNAIRAAKAPNEQQNRRIEQLEAKLEAVEKKLENDKKHLDSIDASNRVTQVALLALLDHGIDGNNIDQMQHAKEELQTHLINR
jgi:septal ring factor EnvC (AmiA/AmiB activator)